MARVKKKDVAQYCYVCQLVGKPNQLISLAKLSHLPVIREPFKHVFVDCVGPLSKTKSGKQFLFTIMCVVGRFLEANPLRKITVPIIMLVKFFSTFKLPKIVQTDKGTFLSKLFKQALKSLTLTHRFSSVYHLQSQGAFKSFHQTLKAILRKYSLDTAKDWEEGVFAVRETVPESRSFSPAELIFGHQVRGPQKVLKEKILATD